MNQERKRIVVLAGAGLAFDVNLPLSIELASRFRKYLDAPAAEGDEEVHNTHRSLYNLIVGGIRFQQGILDRNPDDPINIEQIATAALRLGQRHDNPIAPYVSVWHPRLEQIQREHPTALSTFLSVMYGQLRDWLTPTRGADFGYFASLADLHSEKSCLDIASLNYDLCIETAFTELAERKFVNGFGSTEWRAEEFNNCQDIRLLKLHGSLDWVDDASGYGTCSLEFPRHAKAEELEGLSPLLIFGTDQKLTGKDPFLTLFYHFSNSLRSCCALVVIGYSFADSHINQIIEQRFRENIAMKMLLVSPHASSVTDSQEWLANRSRVTPFNMGAKAAINEKKVFKWVSDTIKAAKDELPF